MNLGRLLMHVAWTFACPGAGQGVVGKRGLTIAWAVAGVATLLAFTWIVWALHAAVVVRLASAGDAFGRLRKRPAGAAEHPNLPLLASAIGVLGFLYLQFATDRLRIPASSMMPTIAIDDQVYVDKVTKFWSPPRRGEVIVFAQPCQPAISYIKRVIAVGDDTVEVRCNQVYVNGKPVPTTLVERACTYVDTTGDDRPHTTTCSRYRETLDGHTYDTFHDGERGERDAAKDRALGDRKDFPSTDRIVRTCGGQIETGGSRRQPQPVGEIVETRPGARACEPQLHLVVPPGTLFVMGDNRSNSNDSRYWGVVPLDHVIGRAIGVVLPIAHTASLR